MFMPKIVDKIEKRKKIAKSTCGLFIEKGFVNISISEIAKVAGVGKGTIYEYFKNKEDIVFELMTCLQEDYDPKLNENLKKAGSAKEKVLFLFDIYLSDDPLTVTQREIYKEFLAICLNNPTDEILTFHRNLKEKYAQVLKPIFQEEIDKGKFLPISLEMITSIFATVEGLFILQDSKQQIVYYIDTLFEILKKR
jgi:AcrR family transcriptional regulator